VQYVISNITIGKAAWEACCATWNLGTNSAFQQYFHFYVHTLPSDGSGTVAYSRSCYLAMTDVSLLVSWLLHSIMCLCQNTVGMGLANSHPGVMIHGFGFGVGDADVPS
jgi:hypothetical protein